MTPLQALQELEKAAASVSAPRDVHVHLMECAKLVGQALMAAAEKNTTDSAGQG